LDQHGLIYAVLDLKKVRPKALGTGFESMTDEEQARTAIVYDVYRFKGRKSLSNAHDNHTQPQRRRTA
jgi:hypothetical protein